MRARKEQEIVCKCPRTVGRFLGEVEDRASVKAGDFVIDLAPGDVPNDGGRWVCPECKAEVARFLGGGRWQVITQA
jgi:hypothetical protein